LTTLGLAYHYDALTAVRRTFCMVKLHYIQQSAEELTNFPKTE